MQVFNVNPEQVVHVASERVAAHHLGPVADRFGERIGGHAAAFLQFHVHVADEGKIDLGRVQQRDVSANDASLFQRPHPPQAGGGRQRHFVRKLLVGEAAVLLQMGKDGEIGAAETGGGHGDNE